MQLLTYESQKHIPWNKGKLLGQKSPLKPKDIWAIRVRIQMSGNTRNLALFNLALDSKLRGCDLVKLKLSDIAPTGEIGKRAKIIQQKTKHPVQFEITKQTKDTLNEWIKAAKLGYHDFLFPCQFNPNDHIKPRQYARIVKSWAEMAGLDPAAYGTHSLRRTKPTLLYRKTHNLRAVQLVLGHTKIESTVRYLGIEVDDALELSEQIEI